VRALWIGIWVDYDVDGDRLCVTLMHGGQIPLPPLAPFERILLGMETDEDDLQLHHLS
jgi:hypothetical protein